MSQKPTSSLQKQIIKVKIHREDSPTKKQAAQRKPKTKPVSLRLKQLKNPKEMEQVLLSQTNILEATRPAAKNRELFAYQQMFYHTVLRSLAGGFDSGATCEELARTVSSVFGVCPVVMEPIVDAALGHAAASRLIECSRGRYVPKNKDYILALRDPDPVPEIKLPREEDAGTLEDIMDRTDDWLHIFKECVMMTREKLAMS